MSSIKFSALFRPTTLFSLKSSNSTNSGAKSLFLPSPYAIKMALLNQALTLEGIDFESGAKKNEWFKLIRDSKIEFFIKGSFCVNNCFIKILKVKEDKRNKKQKEEGIQFIPGMQNTISFREYVHINEPIEIIFTVSDEQEKSFLKSYIHRINYFGKRGCFFQFLQYSDQPSTPNVINFQKEELVPGLLQNFDDFGRQLAFDNVNNFSSKSTKRENLFWVLPLERVSSSKSYTHYRSIN